MRKEGALPSSNRVCVKTGGEWGIVCADADIDQHGFMTWMRNRKRQRYTRNLFNRFTDALQCDYLTALGGGSMAYSAPASQFVLKYVAVFKTKQFRRFKDEQNRIVS